MDLCVAAESAREKAVTRSTTEKHTRAWKRWETFLASIQLDEDSYLDSFPTPTKTRILSIFAQFIRDREHSTGNGNPLAAGTCRDAVDCVAQAFTNKQLADPRHDSQGKLSRILSRQYAGYKTTDPPLKQQKAAPISLLRIVEKLKTTPRQQAIGELVIGAFFFAMRSCEYLEVATKEGKTKRLRLRNIRFFRQGRVLQHSDPTTPSVDLQLYKER